MTETMSVVKDKVSMEDNRQREQSGSEYRVLEALCHRRQDGPHALRGGRIRVPVGVNDTTDLHRRDQEKQDSV